MYSYSIWLSKSRFSVFHASKVNLKFLLYLCSKSLHDFLILMFFSSSWERGDFPHLMLRPTRDLLLSLSISWDAHRVTKRQWKKLNSSRFLERWLGYNMRFTFPWVFVENTPHLIWIKPEPHTHSLPPWPCNGWANVFSRHQKCISRCQKCIFL